MGGGPGAGGCASGVGRRVEIGQGGTKLSGKVNSKIKNTGLNVGCWNKSRAPFESLQSKVGEIEILLFEHSLYFLGICEANFKAEDTEESVTIPGYDLVWDPGREHNTRKNARVVAYIKSGVQATLRTDLMEADLIPTVWLAVGP